MLEKLIGKKTTIKEISNKHKVTNKLTQHEVQRTRKAEHKRVLHTTRHR